MGTTVVGQQETSNTTTKTSETDIGDKSSKPGLLSQFWGGTKFLVGLLSGSKSTDYEKRLHYLSKEEVAVRARLRQRSARWRRLARTLILSSVVLELCAIGFGVFSTRGPLLPWKDRLIRVGPIFLVPFASWLIYTCLARLHQFRDKRDEAKLQRLNQERHSKIEELKEKTKYYETQQLIHRYDTDPEAKAAAAQVLVSKLGAEAGLKVTTAMTRGTEEEEGEEKKRRGEGNGSGDGSVGRAGRQAAQGGSKESEMGVTAGNLRRRTVNQDSGTKEDMPPGMGMRQVAGNGAMLGGPAGDSHDEGAEPEYRSQQQQGKDGGMGWLSRVAAMLVGEDPAQCYALICERCHAHNGLVPKEDFQVITYFCPYCKHLNGGKRLQEQTQSTGEAGPVAPGTSPNTPRISLVGGLDENMIGHVPVEASPQPDVPTQEHEE